MFGSGVRYAAGLRNGIGREVGVGVGMGMGMQKEELETGIKTDGNDGDGDHQAQVGGLGCTLGGGEHGMPCP